MNGDGVQFPLRLDSTGAIALAPSRVAAAEGLIEQLLFTGLGQRLNHPDLGCGVAELVFDVSTEELRAATQFQVSAALQRWLGDVVRVVSVVVGGSGPEIDIQVSFQLTAADPPRTVVFRR